MMTVFLLGLLVGLDNLQVGAALGLVRMSAGRRWAFAGAFALCETAMPLAGLALGRSVVTLAGAWAEGIGIAVLALCGLLIIALALRGEEAAEETERRIGSSLALAGLPLSLSFDNLAAGVGLGSLGFPVIASALVIGGVSGSLCALGLFAGAWLRRWVPRRAELWSGVYLLILAAGRLVEDLA
jgi:putative Mn2+ efflux pump MntP